ncbi:unnamed protein product [Protopolystoma xenopodis]|uniref:Uncharacterized protein n=1 Tax=Protopolystoma xenopodis TaxID=117903 RepID=A0A448XEJ4_9PLAT|nr:unnamed protein product [Protopolystoma xenopodis]
MTGCLDKSEALRDLRASRLSRYQGLLIRVVKLGDLLGESKEAVEARLGHLRRFESSSPELPDQSLSSPSTEWPTRVVGARVPLVSAMLQWLDEVLVQVWLKVVQESEHCHLLH